jgi:hypothetical protein
LRYSTEPCKNLYAFIVERNKKLCSDSGLSGMIIPHSAFCTERMAPIINLFNHLNISYWISTYSIRPAKLFNGVDQRLAIYLVRFNECEQHFSTTYYHWYEEFRPFIFSLITYYSIDNINYPNSIPKIGNQIEVNIWNKMSKFFKLKKWLYGNQPVYYHNSPRYWIRAMDFIPYFWNEREGVQISSHLKSLKLPSKTESAVTVAALNSSLFFWWFLTLSNCRDLVSRELENFPIGIDQMSDGIKKDLATIADKLMIDLKAHASRREAQYQRTGKVVYDEFYPKHSKPIIDEVDNILGKLYGFNEEELDFIINFNVKYRMSGEEDDA